MRKSSLLLGIVAAFSLAVSAEALEKRSDLLIGATLVAGGSPVNGTFNLVGFDAGAYQVDSAVAYFSFLGDLGVETTLTFTLGAGGFTPTDSTVLGPFITVGGNVVGALALADMQDGSINFTVSAPTSGAIVLLGASLVAQVSAKAEGVADSGTTIGLMGIGLLGMAALPLLRRKVLA